MNLRYAIDGCMSVCLFVCMDGCNDMYCDETTNATNIPFGIDIPLDNINQSICQATSKNSAILAAGRHLEFLKINI
jgi:hypothetical protein